MFAKWGKKMKQPLITYIIRCMEYKSVPGTFKNSEGFFFVFLIFIVASTIQPNPVRFIGNHAVYNIPTQKCLAYRILGLKRSFPCNCLMIWYAIFRITSQLQHFTAHISFFLSISFGKEFV